GIWARRLPLTPLWLPHLVWLREAVVHGRRRAPRLADDRPRDIPQTNVARATGGSARVASLFQRLSPRRDDFLSFDKLIRGVPKLAHSSAPDLRLFGDRKFPHQAVRSSPTNSPTAIALGNLQA